MARINRNNTNFSIKQNQNSSQFFVWNRQGGNNTDINVVQINPEGTSLLGSQIQDQQYSFFDAPRQGTHNNYIKGASTSRPGVRQMQHFTGETNHSKQMSLDQTSMELAGTHINGQRRDSHQTPSIKITKPIISGEVPLMKGESSSLFSNNNNNGKPATGQMMKTANAGGLKFGEMINAPISQMGVNMMNDTNRVILGISNERQPGGSTTQTGWSRNPGVGQESSTDKRSGSQQSPFMMNAGIQGLGYNSQYGFIGGKFMSNYQRLQSEKARNFLENQSKQIASRADQQLQLGGKQLQVNPYQNTAQTSPQLAFNIQNISAPNAGRIPQAGEIQKGITLTITRDRDKNGNVLTHSRDSNIIDVSSSLGEGIIISKINVHQYPKIVNETSLSARKGLGVIAKGELSILSDMRLGPKKATAVQVFPQYKQYTTLSNNGESQAGSQLGGPLNNNHTFKNNEQMPKPASPPPNLDLESIINNSEVYFQNQKANNNKQKPRQLPTLSNMESLNAYNLQFHKQLLHAQALSSTAQATNQGGNLKYHMIRKLLEEANPMELAQIIQLQQIQQALMLQQHGTNLVPSSKQSLSPQHRTISHSKSPRKLDLDQHRRVPDQIQSSKDLRKNEGSMLQGESLLMEDNTNNNMSSTHNNPISRLTNQLSHNKSSKAQLIKQMSAESMRQIEATKRPHLNIQEEQIEGAQKEGLLQQKSKQNLSANQQKFKVQISSNSRDSKEMVVGVSLQKDSSKERSLSIPKQQDIVQKPNPLSVTQGPFQINRSLLQKSSIERRDQNKAQQQQIWENTLCVQIRQLPIYSKNGTAIPLQQFVTTDLIAPKTSSKNRSPENKSGRPVYPVTQVPTKMKHLDSKNTVAISNLQNNSGAMTTNHFLIAQQVQYQSNPATAVGAAINHNKDQYSSSRQRRQKMSMTNKEEMKKGVVLNDPSTKTLGPFEADRQKSYDNLDKSNRPDVTPPPGNQTSTTPISQLGHTIKVPHIEFQRDLNKKTRQMQNHHSPIKPAIDASPTRLHYEKRKSDRSIPPILKDIKQQSYQNSIVLANNQQNSLNSKRNSYFPLQPQKGELADNGRINFATSISQNSLVQTGMDALPMYSIINHTSSDIDQNQSLINQTSTVLQSKNTKSPPIGSIQNNLNAENIQSNMVSERRGSIVVLNVINTSDGYNKSPSRDIEDSSPSMQLENQDSKDEDYQQIVLAPGYVDQHDLPLPMIQDQSRDDSDLRSSTIDIHQQTINDVVNSLEVTLASVIPNSKPKQGATAGGVPNTLILPSLQRKKYPVSFQQQLHSTSASTKEVQIKAIVKRENIREAVERDKQHMELRETKYNQMINCFERLQKNMKNRNVNNLQTEQVSTMGNFNQYDASKFMSTDHYNSIFTHNNGASLQNFNETGGSYINEIQESNSVNQAGFIPSNDSRFFKALQKQMVFTPQYQQETKLMMKTKQQMKQMNMTQAEKMKTKIRGLKTCPFKVVKNGVSLYEQQRQLSRILEVPEIEMIEQVPFLKQTCLVEFVKDQWSSIFQGPSVMKDYQYFCLYYPAKLTYKLIIFGLESPLSNCCNQLIVFHFCQIQGDPDEIKQQEFQAKTLLRVFCSDPECSQYPLFEKIINSKSFVDCILNTQNGPPLPLYVASTVPQMNPSFIDYKPIQNYRMSKTNRSRQNHYSMRPNYHNQNMFNTSRDIMLASEYGNGINSVNGSMFEKGQQGALINSESFEDEDYHLESIQYLKGTQGFDKANILLDPRTIFEQSLSVSSTEQRRNPYAQVPQSKNASLPQPESSFRASKEGTLENSQINDISINKYLNRVKSDLKIPV